MNEHSKHYIRTGQVDPEQPLVDVPLHVAMAHFLRHTAHNDFQPSEPEAQDIRQASRDILAHLTDIDLGMLDYALTSPSLDKDLVLRYLQERGVTTIPILSNTPAEIRAMFSDFDLQVIPNSQYEITNFGETIRESEVPAWFIGVQARAQAEQDVEPVEIVTALRERWFIIVTLLLGILAAIGFSFDWGLELPNILNQFDLFLSFYGMVAISRATLQIHRAEKWNRETRGEIRSEYADALTAILHSDTETQPSEEVQRLIKRAHTIAGASTSLDTFLQKFGLTENPSKKMKRPSLREDINQVYGTEINTDTMINVVSQEILYRNFGETIPSVAVVIPTYQTSLEEMRRLLISIKDQAYPVTTAYVVFNDDPNDLEKGLGKQEQFLALQELVDEINTTSGRNTCEIVLLAQGARGKREAMAMGFAMALGKDYYQDLQNKYPEISPRKLKKAIANLDLSKLPDFRHDYVLNIDSDTEIHDPLSVLNSAILMEKHPLAATTTGDVRVVNRNINLLSEMTYQRYWRAFFVERAAQAPEVTCMSGPWVFMRSEPLAFVLDQWYYQEFLGQRCTYGDDRHLSTLFLQNGWESLFCPDSAVLTDCPTEWGVFLKQQLRWNKSFNRENFQLFKFIHEMSKFVQFDVAYQQSFPFAMLYILTNVILKGVGAGVEFGAAAGAEAVLPYVVTILLYNELFFGLYGALKNQDPKYFLSPTYIGYHFSSLIWLKIWAFFKLKDTTWGTKGEELLVEDVLQDFEAEKERFVYELVNEVIAEKEKPPTNLE